MRANYRKSPNRRQTLESPNIKLPKTDASLPEFINLSMLETYMTSFGETDSSKSKGLLASTFKNPSLAQQAPINFDNFRKAIDERIQS